MIKKLVLEKADRLYHLPQTVDEFLPRRERRKLLGTDIYDLARFTWPERQPEELPATLRPATIEDISVLAEKTAAWYQKRYHARINPAKEVFIGGSIRSILNLAALAFLNPGDVVLIPDPGVWHYRAAAVLASAETVPYHLSERARFKPVVSTIANNLARLAKALVLNSIHNPTGSVLGKEELEEILRLAGRENLLLILDQAFEGLIDSANPASLYALPGGRKVSLEVYSYAYNFGQPLPSVGFAIGQPALISGLKRVAQIFGQGVTDYQIRVGAAACESEGAGLDRMKSRYAENRNTLDQLCRKLRLMPAENRVGPFYWAKLPGRKLSRHFCRVLYLKCGILAVPGIAFGENGEGYVRFSLTGDPETYQRALKATGRFLQSVKERKRADG